MASQSVKTPDSLKEITSFMDRLLGHTPLKIIRQFTQKIHPELIQNQKHYQQLFEAIKVQLRSKNKQRVPYQEAVDYLAYQAYRVNPEFSNRIKILLQNDYFQRMLKNSIQKSFHDNNRQELKCATISSSCLQQMQMNSKSKSSFNLNPIRPAKKQTLQMGRQHIDNNMIYSNHNPNLFMSKPTCICTSPKDSVFEDFSDMSNKYFTCTHCSREFHRLCMKKKMSENFCCYCHLQLMQPLKKIMETVYIGILRKNVKKHGGTFSLPHLEPNQKIQVRCIRLKEGAQTSCLFPDKAQFIFNKFPSAKFEPINKLSCLKYRKDEPFCLKTFEIYKGQQNEFHISEFIPQNRQQQARYQSETHMLGIYIVQDMKIQQYIQRALDQRINGYTDSHNILLKNFRLGSGDQDISCELIKIPLMCPLTTAKIQIPVRGAYCNHFQCFDLKNYLVLISQSQNPRWKCPVCNALAHDLQIDSIVMQILKKTSNQKVKEILFWKDGSYTQMIDEQPGKEKHYIKDLNIPQRKRKNNLPIFPQQLQIPQKPQKPKFVLPENAQVIELD